MAATDKNSIVNIGKILARVRKPSRYIGNEFNACQKDWDTVAVRMALVFPDLYEIGMSHHGLQILYAIINSRDNLLADRVYCPDRDMEELLRTRGEMLFGLETRRGLADFDMIGITLPYELCYTNILTILDLAGIPKRASARTEAHPYIIGGGSGSFNPEPVAEFFDAILLGDGEEAVLEIAALLESAREAQWSRAITLEKLAEIPGIYVPTFFEPAYDAAGKLKAVRPLRDDYRKVQRRILPDLEWSAVPERPLVPLVRIIHDRLGIEVARGCTRGCRFCQAGIIYRPVRERTADRVIALAEKGMAAGGFEELALLSLSTGDYSCLTPALGRLMDTFERQHISVSMPSMRVGTLTPEIMAQIRRVRKTGFTLAPEAGTDRLRQVINKGITEADLLETCKSARDLGWYLLKFYFMFGLPTETDEDVEAIGTLVRRAAHAAADRRLRINVSVATFVPKPHTPFQWEPQLSIDEAYARLDLLKKSLPRGNCKLKWHDPRQSFLEGVMSRGDRRLASVIEEAWNRGARLDAWNEHYDLDLWLQAAEARNVDMQRYLRRREFSEILPWQHLDTGVDGEFLRAELEKSLEGRYTPDCRVHKCQKCGVCDFKTISPVVRCRPQKDPTPDTMTAQPDRTPLPDIEDKGGKETGEHPPHHWYRLHYSKQGDIRFLSHLEMIQVFFQAFRRAGIVLNFTQGFNPVPRASFSPALPVGTASLAEYIDVDLVTAIADEAAFLHGLNTQLPGGIRVESVGQLPDGKSGTPVEVVSYYTINLGNEIAGAEKEKLAGFMESESFSVRMLRKGKVRTVDIRPQVERLAISGKDSVDLVLVSREGRAAGKPIEILKAILDFSEEQCLAVEICKTRTGEVL